MVAQRAASNKSTQATVGSDNRRFEQNPNLRALRLAPAFLPKLGRFSCSTATNATASGISAEACESFCLKERRAPHHQIHEA
jgi:hypothetical protein